MAAGSQTNHRSSEYLIGTLAVALYWVDESLQRSLEAAGYSRMSRTRSMIMLNLAMGVRRPARIAANIGVSRQAVHQMLQEMAAEKLVKFSPDPSDKRAKLVDYSAGSKQIRRAAEQCVQNIEAELEARIGQRTMAQLKKALAKDWGAPVVLPRQ